LRTILAEAAWTTIRVSAWWRTHGAQFDSTDATNQSHCGNCRKLLVVIWQVLSAQTADQQADPVAVV